MAARKTTTKKTPAPKRKRATRKTATPESTGRKIAILGTTPSRMQAPIAEDSGWEIWTIGPGGKNHHRWDRLFEIHNTWPESFNEYIDELKAVKLPQQVWTMSPLPGCEANVVYPKDDILKKYGRRMWFSSSISYCLALAIEERPTDIGLWGIDLESGEEYISQFIGCAHFIDLAVLTGIKVHMPNACGLLRDLTPYPERYETNLALYLESKYTWLAEQLGQARPRYDSKKAEVHRNEGFVLQAREDGASDEKITELEALLLSNNIELGNMSNQVQQLQGEQAAIQHIRRMYVWGFEDPD